MSKHWEYGIKENNNKLFSGALTNNKYCYLEHQERIFRILERLHGAESYPGTGIGSAIVRKGVERMGGIFGVESLAWNHNWDMVAVFGLRCQVPLI